MWKFLKNIGRAITFFRNFILNLLFLGIVIIIVLAIVKSPKPTITDDSPLVLKLEGVLVDQLTYDPSIVGLLDPDMAPPKETLLSELTEALDLATYDERISGLYLDLSQFQGGSISKILELGEAVARFKTSGKPVSAYGVMLDQNQYLLASFADDILIHEMGGVALYGLASYRFYLEEALDKIDMGFHVFRAGDYKDAVEPFIRDSMSDPSREQNRRWLMSLWNQYTQQLEANRGLEMGAIDNFVNAQADLYKAASGDAAALAIQTGLVDKVVSIASLNDYLRERFGLIPDEKEGNTAQTLLSARLPDLIGKDLDIAYIAAVGAITEGRQPAGAIGSATLIKLLEKAADGDHDALVIRVDSGGGSAFASELIREKIAELMNDGLPVYISMGSVAASGGYWIATAAKEIWAQPSTITGSIGVFGLLPDLSGTVKKIGLNEDGVATTELASQMSLYRPLSDNAKQILQENVSHTYQEFLTLVASSRDLPLETVAELASGRVWIGSTAKELGLVDELGSLHQLFEHIASGKRYDVTPIRRDLNSREELLRAFSASQSSQFLSAAIKASFAKAILSDSGLQDLAFVTDGSRTGSKVLGLNPQTLSSKQNQTKNPLADFHLRIFAGCELCELK